MLICVYISSVPYMFVYMYNNALLQVFQQPDLYND